MMVSWTDADEDRYEAHQPAALCEACGKRRGEVAQDGDWLCSVCASALETAETEGETT